MRSRWGAIANPHAKVFDPPPPSTPSPTPGAWPQQQNKNSIFFDPLGTPAPLSPTPWAPRRQNENPVWYVLSICFVSLIWENTHKVWYKSHNLFSSKFLSFTIYSETERTMAQLMPYNVKTHFV